MATSNRASPTAGSHLPAPSARGPGWIAATGAAFVALAAGLAVGFVFGTERGRGLNRRERDEAIVRADDAAERQRHAEAKLATSAADAERERDRNAAAVAEGEQKLKAAGAEVAEARKLIPPPKPDPRTAAEVVTAALGEMDARGPALPNAEREKLAVIRSSLNSAIAAHAKTIPRPDKITEGVINYDKNTVGLAGGFDGVPYLETIIDDTTALVRVETTYGASAVGTRVVPSQTFTVYYVAQNFDTVGKVDGKEVEGVKKWLIVGTKKYGGKTLWVVEPFAK